MRTAMRTFSVMLAIAALAIVSPAFACLGHSNTLGCPGGSTNDTCHNNNNYNNRRNNS